MAVLCLPLVFGATPLRAAAAELRGEGDGAARALAERVLTRPGYQTELPLGDRPGAEEEDAEKTRGWWRMGEGWGVPIPTGLGGLLKLLVWIGAAALGVLALVHVARLALDRAGSRRPGAGHDGDRERTGQGSGLASSGRIPSLGTAERLAADGRYGEAVHLLLIRALFTVAKRRGGAFPGSATSREILDARSLDPDMRGPLGDLVTAVERFLFGGVELDVEAWERCRAAFTVLEGRG